MTDVLKAKAEVVVIKSLTGRNIEMIAAERAYCLSLISLGTNKVSVDTESGFLSQSNGGQAENTVCFSFTQSHDTPTS